MFAANLLGRRLVQVWETALGKIPLVRNIYNSVKQISTTLLASQSKSFRKVVLVEYPRKDCWCIGFLSNEHVETDRRITDQQLQSIYLPTTPNPTSGFNLLIPERDIIELDMSVEDGLQVHHFNGSDRAGRGNQANAAPRRGSRAFFRLLTRPEAESYYNPCVPTIADN